MGRTELILNDSVDKVTARYIRIEGDRIYIQYDLFKELGSSAGYLYETIKKMGFNYEQCRQMMENSKGQSGKIFLSDTHRVVMDRENIIIELITNTPGNSAFEVNELLEELFTGMHSYHFKVIERAMDFKIPTTSPEKIALDFDKLVFPLKIRKWENGDRFYPLGMSKPKKVSDFLIDSKVSIPDKNHIYVLVSGNEIAWLIGYRPDERFKVTEGTKKIYLCTSQKAIGS